MGTNYYWQEKSPCSSCGQDLGEQKHIGKSSGGWCFALHVYPEDNILDLSDWEKLFATPESYIKDEYGDLVTVPGMLSIIKNRSWPIVLPSLSMFDYDSNHAQPGPNGLVRANISAHCIKHGEGTWDCFIGDFS